MPASTERGDPSGKQTVASPAEPGRGRTIEHDEFDPIGTLVLIVLYFLVLVVMWLFTYFVEFLGNDPTPIGLV